LVLLALIAPISLIAPAHADQTHEYLRERLEQLQFVDQTTAGDQAIVAPDVIYGLYQRRDLELVWNDERLEDLRALLALADENGLDPEDYHYSEVLAQPPLDGLDPEARVDADLFLTEALLRAAYHLRFGKVDPSSFDANFNYGRRTQGQDPVANMELVLAADTLREGLAELVNVGPITRGLRPVLEKYRAMAEKGEWAQVPEGPTLRVGDDDPRVPALRRRLAHEGFAVGNLDATRFDSSLEEQVKAFQQRYAIDVDGAVGPGTLAALNVSLAARIDQIRVNLERIRWVGSTRAARFVAVNIAGFRVYLVENDKPVWSGRAQVGKPYRQTPVFTASMKYVVLNPDWTVPPGILRKDVVPALKRDPEYAAKKNMEILDSDGNRIDPANIDFSKGFPYRVRQVPGPWNALGEVKFIFPNKHFVFLHDTPSKALFERTERTFSSGCIRVEQPFELAELLLADPVKWNREGIDAVLATGDSKTVFLPEPMTVMIFYLTAIAFEGREFQFLPDVYNRDAKVLPELDEPFRYIPPEGVPGFGG
jgi:murein L,D-transpeptidase YcbB/YkuD